MRGERRKKEGRRKEEGKKKGRGRRQICKIMLIITECVLKVGRNPRDIFYNPCARSNSDANHHRMQVMVSVMLEIP